MTVAEKLVAVGKIIDELRATPCESCGHPYGKHQWAQQCTAFVSFADMKGVVCKCKKYIDPEETLNTKEDAR